jgi:hypothetical protein
VGAVVGGLGDADAVEVIAAGGLEGADTAVGADAGKF